MIVRDIRVLHGDGRSRLSLFFVSELKLKPDNVPD
jgi:hypothetical protein